MSAKTIGIVAVVVVVVGAGYLFFRGGNDDMPQASVSPEMSVAASVSPVSSASESMSPSPVASGAATSGPVKTFKVSGGMYYFNPKEIKVNKGDTVKIEFTNAEGFHDWVIDEFNARTPRIKAGETSTIQFVADKTGSFQYYCSVGTHRAQGMWGTLIVQ